MKRSSVLLFRLLLPLIVATVAGCADEKKSELRLGDLTPAENRYITRIVILERAKAVALVEREAGTALLDSLAAAWGDSCLRETLAGTPSDPRRSVQVHTLLTRILTAERDSLVEAPRPDRLAVPLQDPPPAGDPAGSQ